LSGHSLRLRLLLGAGAWIAVALVLAGAAIVFIFSASVERGRYEDLLASLDRVLTSVSGDGLLSEIQPGLSDPRYDAAAGGLYWQVIDLDTGQTIRSRSLWDTGLPVPAPPSQSEPEDGMVPGPAGQTVDTLTQDVAVTRGFGTRQLRVTVGEDSAIRGGAIYRFALDIAGALLALGVALVLAGWLTVHLGLSPLNAVRGELEAITGGRAIKLGGRYPQEVLPLVDEVNALLAGHERSITFARARADDLAHGLKTPLAVLSATAARLRAQGDTANADVLDMLGEEMVQRVDYQLRLAQLRVRSGEHTLSASLDQALLRSVSVLRKTGRGEELFWKLDIDKVTVDMDPHDLMELIGVLLENATKWALSEVRVVCRADSGTAEFEVIDDGPGMTDEQIASLGQRGRRLDEARSGTGFGIAIAKEILNLNGGTLDLGRAATGGLRIAVRIPAVQSPLASGPASA
jgi:signal transduction histidine kinase